MVVSLSLQIQLVKRAVFVLGEDNFALVVGEEEFQVAAFRLEFFDAGDLDALENAVAEFADDVVVGDFEDGEEARNSGEDDKAVSDEDGGDFALVDVVEEFIVVGGFDV